MEGQGGVPPQGEMGEGGQKIQTSSYKINSGDVMSSILTIVNITIYLKVAENKS